MAFGVQDEGFNIKSFSEVRESLQTRAAGKPLLAALDTDPETVFGEIIDIFSSEISDMWELAEDVSGITNPEVVEGVFQDNNYAMVGVSRLAAAPSTTYLRYIGDQGSAIPIAGAVGIPGTPTAFQPDVNSSLSISEPMSYIEITMTSTALGARSVTIDGTTVTFTATGTPTLADIAAGLALAINNDATASLVVTALDNNDSLTITADTGSYNFEYVNLSTGLMSDGKMGRTLASSATTNGPLSADIGQANQLINSITGVDSASNTTIAILGRLVEGDTEYAERRRNSLAIIGSGTLDSMVDNVSALTGVTRVTGVENTSNSVDGEGRPGKSFEIITTGGEDQSIAELIWRIKPAGIESFGNINGGTGIQVKDTSGNTQLVKFSRPLQRALSLLVRYKVYGEEDQPTQLQSAITDAVVNYINSLVPGKDVLPQRIESAIFTDVSGLQQIEVYVTASADSTPPADPTGIPAERDPIIIAAAEYVSLAAVDVNLAVIP